MPKNHKPRFQVEELEGMQMRTFFTPRMQKNKKTKELEPAGGFDTEEKEVPAGWMVYFPRGSSIHVWTQAEMERLGFDKPAMIVDVETGDVVGIENVHNFKAIAQQKSARSQRSSAANL